MQSSAKTQTQENEQAALTVWREAIRILSGQIPKFKFPAWFACLAKNIPTDDSRARRDVPRFLTLLKAVALCLRFSDGRRETAEIEISFSDYCVAWEILHEAFASTYRGAHPQALRLGDAVRDLHSELKRPVSVQELADNLGWKPAVVYKWRKAALKLKLVQQVDGTQPQNKKPLLPGPVPSSGFLPHPKFVFRERSELGETARYLNPLTGTEKVLRRSQKGQSGN